MSITWTVVFVQFTSTKTSRYNFQGTNAFSQMYPDILDLNDPTITPLCPKGTEPNKNDFNMLIVVDPKRVLRTLPG